MFPLSSVIKDAFDKFEHDFQATNLPEGKYIKQTFQVVQGGIALLWIPSEG